MFLFVVHYNNGDYMRWIYILVIVMFLFLGYDTKSSYSVSDDSYNLHTLGIDNLSTNNFLNYFKDINVIRIYPYINPIYKDNLGDVSYRTNGVNLAYDIDNFRDEYLSLIKKNSYLDYNYLFVNGININRVDVYLSDRQLLNLINSDLIINFIK